VLRELEKKGMVGKFILSLLEEYTSFEQMPHFLQFYMLDTTGKLAKAAITFLEKK